MSSLGIAGEAGPRLGYASEGHTSLVGSPRGGREPERSEGLEEAKACRCLVTPWRHPQVS